MRKIAMVFLALCALIGWGARAEGDLKIVCTDFPCYDFARQTAGPEAEVTMLLKPGVEAHSYEPTPADILAIGRADLFVYIGGESDVWADNILAGFDADGPRILRMMDCVETLIEEESDAADHAPEYDEHIWTSPRNAVRMVSALGQALADIDPENAARYVENAENYAGTISDIDRRLSTMVDGAARKTLVFADRFPFVYLTRDYGLDYLAAFPSCTADTEPSAQILRSLIDRVQNERIPVVYTIELSTQSIARTVSEETGAGIMTLHSMQTLSQADFDAGKTYASIMEENLEALKAGLY